MEESQALHGILGARVVTLPDTSSLDFSCRRPLGPLQAARVYSSVSEPSSSSLFPDVSSRAWVAKPTGLLSIAKVRLIMRLAFVLLRGSAAHTHTPPLSLCPTRPCAKHMAHEVHHPARHPGQDSTPATTGISTRQMFFHPSRPRPRPRPPVARRAGRRRWQKVATPQN